MNTRLDKYFDSWYFLNLWNNNLCYEISSNNKLSFSAVSIFTFLVDVEFASYYMLAVLFNEFYDCKR